MARPTKLNDETAKRIIAGVREGLFLTTAAALAGVDRTTVRDWLARGEAESPPDEDQRYVDFALAYREAEAQAVQRAVRAVRKGKDKTKARGMAWWLERSHPTMYGRRIVQEHVGADGGPINMQHSGAVMFFPAEDPSDDDDGGAGGGAGGGPAAAP